MNNLNRYSGGKGKTYQKFINRIPPHEVYIESHLGGGSIMRHKRPAQRNIGIDIDLSVIEMWSCKTGLDLEIFHQDAIEYLQNYNFTGNEMVYCDPPYLRETRKKHYPIYKYEYTTEQHIELLKVIKGLPCMVMISGYHSQLYMDSLKDWNTHSFQAKTHHHMATEFMWMNYSTPVELHDYRYLGDDYRERERIKKKSERWVEKLKKMPVLERQGLLAAIQSVKQESEW
jgi:site-specific DNA-adenine methylase